MKTVYLIIIALLFLLKVESITNSCADDGEDGSCLVDNDTEVETDVAVPKGANEYGKPREVSIDKCLDRYEDCVEFANNGECIQNPGWMIINCPLSCESCHLRNPNIRCARSFLNVSDEPIYYPGDLNKVFGRIENEFGNRYKVEVLSRSPWVVIFDDFLDDEEINALIETVDKWERSTDTGQMNEFGEAGRMVSTGRTSSNAWCREACESHPAVQRATAKIEEVTKVPNSHYESYQVLRYDLGQKYNVHHDSDESDNQIPCGPRILTFFLYLSDVEEGGETAFPALNISVKPKKGRALLWPSVLDENPRAVDHRMLHEARPVIKGRKFAANSWIHLYDFRQSNLWGCTGAFDEL